MQLVLSHKLLELDHLHSDHHVQNIPYDGSVDIGNLLGSIDRYLNDQSTQADMDEIDNGLTNILNQYLPLFLHTPVIQFLYGDNPREPLLEIWGKRNGTKLVELRLILPHLKGNSATLREKARHVNQHLTWNF